MSNQNFDSVNDAFPNANNGHDSPAGVPVPIAQQITTQAYLSSVQNYGDLADESSNQEAAENAAQAMGSHADSSPIAPRGNKMDAFFEKIEREQREAELAAQNPPPSQPPMPPQQDESPTVSGAAPDVQTYVAAPMDFQSVNVQNVAPESMALPPAGSPERQPFEPSSQAHAQSNAHQAADAPTDTTTARPTGAAGLSAGLAAAGMGTWGARLAEESTQGRTQDFTPPQDASPAVDEQPTNHNHSAQSFPHADAAESVLPPIAPISPINTAHLNSPGKQEFDLEAARLQEVSGAPLYSQEYEEKPLSPQDRLADRLHRENLLPQQQSQPQSQSLSETPSPQPTELPTAASLSSLPLEMSRRLANDFGEIQSPNQPVALPPQHSQPQHSHNPQPQQSVSPPVAAPPVAASPAPTPTPAEPQSAPAATALQAERDQRLMQAEQLEQEHRERQRLAQAASETERADRARFEQERIAAEASKLGLVQQKQQEDLAEVDQQATIDQEAEVDQQAGADRQAALLQAERVKLVREKVASASLATTGATALENVIYAVVDGPDVPAPAPIPEPFVQPEINSDPQSTAQPPATNTATDASAPPVAEAARRPTAASVFQPDLFFACMLEHLSDGVVFVDHAKRVKMWSRGAEKMTGIIPGVVIDRPLLPQTFNLCDTNDNGIQLDACPLAKSLRTLEIVHGEFKIANGSPQGLKVELSVIPVIDSERYVNGAVITFHDRSAQVDLQRQLKDLYEFSVLDPLTQVANRAEFERVQQEYVLAFQQSENFNCSIIICDIDFFKSINDKFGHAVGDQALVSFAEMLKRYVRAQDLVARYGGEEFVILCADCDTAAAVQRAEEIRMALYKTPQPMLEGKSISASFGVSELREGDTSMDFFVRADTALLKAKESGRNRVVAGDGSGSFIDQESNSEVSAVSGIAWKPQRRESKALICEEFQTETPVQVLIEKLRGFIIEKEATLQRVEPELLSMEVEFESASNYSHKGVFTMNIEFKEGELNLEQKNRPKKINFIRVTIFAGRLKKWFSTNHTDLAPRLLSELRTYLMINDKASRVTVELATENVRANDAHELATPSDGS